MVANLLSALAGGGAGLLQLPALIFLGLPFGIALATHKIATVALGLGSTYRHLKSNQLNRTLAMFILFTGLPGVVLGAHIILSVPEHSAQLALGVLTTGLGIYSFLRKQFGLQEQAKNRHPLGYCLGGLGLFSIGLLNGSLTSGTGLFVTLWLVLWFGLSYQMAVAYTMVLVGIFWNASGALTLAWQSPVQWNWLPALVLGSLIGGYFGAHLSIKQGSRLIKPLFEGLCILVGLGLIVRAV